MLKLEIEITDEQLAAIDHVAREGADAWCRHAFEHFVSKIITDKAAKYQPEYQKAKAAEGVNYKTAAVRAEEGRVAKEQEIEAARLSKAAEVEAAKAAKIAALVATGLTQRQAEILVT